MLMKHLPSLQLGIIDNAGVADVMFRVPSISPVTIVSDRPNHGQIMTTTCIDQMSKQA